MIPLNDLQVNNQAHCWSQGHCDSIKIRRDRNDEIGVGQGVRRRVVIRLTRVTRRARRHGGDPVIF